jgi:2,4-didehydro-3-deoxy-L-rhamnonate hydrolase
MRLCRIQTTTGPEVAFYGGDSVSLVTRAATAARARRHAAGKFEPSRELLDYLPPEGPLWAEAQALDAWRLGLSSEERAAFSTPIAEVEMLTPIPRPHKLFLLAGNYADHVREQGGAAAERAETFPYVFMKPPSTTLTDPGKPIVLPTVSPHAIDWELELAVVMGRRAKCVAEVEALDYVAGYTVINDISNRKFRPFPERKKRDRDAFFDWLHGKWFDSFCPCGPCVLAHDGAIDPQAFDLELRLNGEIRQSASTALQVFPVAAVIEFISQMCTLEPGDLISTGTPAGVGNATGTYLKPGDLLEAEIRQIGVLHNPVVGES